MTLIMSTYLYALFPFTETSNQWTTEEIEPQLRTISPIQKECAVFTTHSQQDKNGILTSYEPLTSQFSLFIIRYQNNLINSANSSRNSWYFLSISAIAFSYSSLPTDFPLIEYEAVEVEGLQFAQSQSQSSSS